MARPSLFLALFLGLCAGCGSGGAGAPAGDAADTEEDDGGAVFTLPERASVTAVEPDTGFAPGRCRVRIRGSGFDALGAGPEVRFGFAQASSVQILDDELLTCIAPANNPGTVDVSVSRAGGLLGDTLDDGFTYYTDPPAFQSDDIRVEQNDVFTDDSVAPQICCDGDDVYVVWWDLAATSDVLFNRSHDGGKTWHGVDTRLNDSSEVDGNGDGIRICCSGKRVYVVWEDGTSIYFNHSTDGGATWEGEQRIDHYDPASSIDPEICCSGSSVYVVWRDGRDGLSDIYFNRSLDGGSTWEASDTRLDTSTPGAALSDRAAICCEGSRIYVVWYAISQTRAGDILLNRSADGGTTWLTQTQQIDDDPLGEDSSVSPQICCDGDRVYIVWEDERDGFKDVYADRSKDGGVTWAADRRLDTDTPSARDSQDPRICCDGASAYVVWLEEIARGEANVHLSRTSDGGDTWSATEVRMDSANTPSIGFAPHVCCSGSHVYVVWADAESGVSEVLLNRSYDGGSNWLDTELLVSRTGAGTRNSRYPRICCDGARVRVVWVESQGGSHDIFVQHNEPAAP